MSSTVGMTAGLLQELELAPGDRVPDVGTGARVTAVVACLICGDAGADTVDRDATSQTPPAPTWPSSPTDRP